MSQRFHPQRQVIVILHNLRSTHNVGAIFRTADGFGVQKVYLTGYTPYPMHDQDDRLPYLARKIDAQIHKTALDAESFVPWEQTVDILPLLSNLKEEGYTIAALEQSSTSVALTDYHPPAKLAIIVGRETEGIEQEIVDQADTVLEIPMAGHKESFNVASAAAIALYHVSYG